MNVSRPTFTRIYNIALELIAKAFVEGKAIEIEGGNYELEKDWYRCKKCYKLIEGLENHFKCKDCTAYGENELIKLN
jgi:Zn finger protein HypA/HybF involved in hydrogenase expression